MKLRYYQIDARKALDQYLIESKDNPLLVLPTGSGKSLVIADFIDKNFEKKILLLTHRKELIEQNFEELKNLNKKIKAGIYSASLSKKELQKDIVFASIQSISRILTELKYYDYVIIDEAHIVSANEKTQYHRVLKKLKSINPKIRIIGLSATPYRMNSGLLTEGANKIFKKIIYEISITELIDKGFLCPLISTRPIDLNLKNISISNGEYNSTQLQKILSESELIDSTIKDLIERGKNRKSWLIFAIGKRHLDAICKALAKYKISNLSIHNDLEKSKRDKNIELFKKGKITALVNIDILTTGFNAPNIDLIAMLRPTRSVGLYVQMVGRGLRKSPEKENCLILDYANNIKEHGPIDLIKIAKNSSHSYLYKDLSYIRICPSCQSPMRLEWKECKQCGKKVESNEYIINHEISPSKLSIMSGGTGKVYDDLLPHANFIIDLYKSGNSCFQISKKLIEDGKNKLFKIDAVMRATFRILKNFGTQKNETIEERFNKNIIIINECWEWQKVGYDRRDQTLRLDFAFNGKNLNPKKFILKLNNNLKNYSSNHFILQKCNNNICVNPEHLEVTLRKDMSIQNSCQITLLNTITNKIKKFSSQKSAANFLGISRSSIPGRYDRGGLIGDYKIIELKLQKKEKKEISIIAKDIRKKIKLQNIQTNEIKKFNSQLEAAAFLGISNSYVRKCVRLDRNIRGYKILAEPETT